MKISAYFSNIDEADSAVRAIKDKGITIRSRRRNNVNTFGNEVYFPLYPEGDSGGAVGSFGLTGISEYSYSRGAVFISTLDHIEQHRDNKGSEVQLVLEVNESDAQNTCDTIINHHGMNVRRY